MKRLYAGVIGAMAAFSAVCYGQNAPESPQDYLRGVELSAQGGSPWYQVPLPEAVYQQSAWADLRDIRVFNQQGASLPFALETTVPPAPAPQTAPLTLYKLESQPLQQKDEEGNRAVLLKTPEGVEIRLASQRNETLSGTWLIPLGEGEAGSALKQLRFSWPRQREGWQARVDIYSSEGLRHWQPEISDAPLMDLTSGDNRLLLDKLDFDAGLALSGAKYLLVIVKNASAPLDFTGVSGEWQTAHLQPARIALPAQGEKTAEDTAVYRWARPQPLDALTLRPAQENAVMPVEIEYRSDEKAPWRPLARTVIYRLPDSPAVSVPLQGEPIAAVRVKAINQRLGDTLVEVTGERDEKTLIFNAQGNGPFLLAWGNGAATPQTLALQALIPAKANKAASLDALPYAQAGKQVELGGKARLTAKDPAAQRNQLQTWLIWGVLVAGAAGLLLLAWRLWREVNAGKAA
ncbi:DUF3999 family protein [Franconibacter pulveris]|uniref:DUF3999 domain-containing protein n=1 Tax=Franconibacter pulveris TaxID=435910 RepID=A0A0J8YFM6_9ENTR|nr:DUF3999 family protein [Franconibacter pulveris]KMV36304.1 hypothetical protein ACH50_02535 [Franconibacter pulveris]